MQIPPDLVQKQEKAWNDLYADIRTGVYNPDDPVHSGILPLHRTAAESRRLSEMQDDLPANDPGFVVDPNREGQIDEEVYNKSKSKLYKNA